jgi:hypothetical protein
VEEELIEGKAKISSSKKLSAKGICASFLSLSRPLPS